MNSRYTTIENVKVKHIRVETLKRKGSVMYLSLASKSAFISLDSTLDLVRRGQIINMNISAGL